MKPIEITLHGHFEARCDEYGLRTVRNRPRGSSPAPALPIVFHKVVFRCI
jgi:hypothetical protein